MALAGRSGSVLNRSGERRHPYLTPDLEGKALSSAIKYATSCGFFMDALYRI